MSASVSLQSAPNSDGGFTAYQPASQPTSRVVLVAAGMRITQFFEIDIDRDLKNIAGTFELMIFDQARVAEALSANGFGASYGGYGGSTQPVTKGLPAQIYIDGELLLDGYIDKVRTKWSHNKLQQRIIGRDKTGDLVDCAAVPQGPAEFKNVDLLHIATALCMPFGIKVTLLTDIGDPFVRLAIGPHETVLAALEKGARQRSTLLVSDGIGGLQLTKGGNSRAPASIQVGDNVHECEGTQSWEKRFSDVYVKGQTERCAGARKGVPVHLDSSVAPLTGNVAPAPTVAPEASAILMTGHATDPEITRYRPTVRLTRTQSGSSSTQEQAEWAVRVARGEGDDLFYTVLDWRAPEGPSGTLWRPNQVTALFDPFVMIDKDMLIAGTKFAYSAKGMMTKMRVVGVTAYDRINEAAKKKGPKQKQGAKPLDATVSNLTAP
jgi:prophage tail gpP-like protein